MCVYVCISVCGASRSWDIVVHAALQSIRFDGDRIVAGFTRDSPSGDISRSGTETLKFQATGLDPSDPSNSVQSLRMHNRTEEERFSFKCERPDGISPCFKEAEDGSFYTGLVDGRQWELKVAQCLAGVSQMRPSSTISSTNANLNFCLCWPYLRQHRHLNPVAKVPVVRSLSRIQRKTPSSSASPLAKALVGICDKTPLRGPSACVPCKRGRIQGSVQGLAQVMRETLQLLLVAGCFERQGGPGLWGGLHWHVFIHGACEYISAVLSLYEMDAVKFSGNKLGNKGPAVKTVKKWTINGALVEQRHLLEPSTGADNNDVVNAASITVSPYNADNDTSIIPSSLQHCKFPPFTISRSGRLDIKCTIEYGEGASGVAGTSIVLVGSPAAWLAESQFTVFGVTATK
eukprot:scaffold67195_cov35-Tisochrysis_lutea.AAC.2